MEHITIKASEGKVFRRIADGVIFGNEITKDKRESPRLKPWAESGLMVFLILDISDYGISRNATNRLAKV